VVDVKKTSQCFVFSFNIMHWVPTCLHAVTLGEVGLLSAEENRKGMYSQLHCTRTGDLSFLSAIPEDRDFVLLSSNALMPVCFAPIWTSCALSELSYPYKTMTSHAFIGAKLQRVNH
jgi:hypothetical protein